VALKLKVVEFHINGQKGGLGTEGGVRKGGLVLFSLKSRRKALLESSGRKGKGHTSVGEQVWPSVHQWIKGRYATPKEVRGPST